MTNRNSTRQDVLVLVLQQDRLYFDSNTSHARKSVLLFQGQGGKLRKQRIAVFHGQSCYDSNASHEKKYTAFLMAPAILANLVLFTLFLNTYLNKKNR
ncbi:hypothetical protein [Virgibacillus proomii]|uniref:hypothetical protein n=1 Tax=Virgibacillus proomii TaxID=84407 RepID=UPI001C10589F|nr:hypothetical protein [Virgibacillus proomii]MBU5267207.1 hypothetical protein [Virgibacillus proomii]